MNREIFSILVAILENLNFFFNRFFQNYFLQILKCFNMPGRGRPKAKVNPKPKPSQKYNVPIGFDDLDPQYGMYMPVVLTDVLMGA